MPTSPDRMNEIAHSLAEHVGAGKGAEEFRELWADEVTFWTCYGDDMDWTGDGAAKVVQAGTGETGDAMAGMDDLRVRVAGDSVVVQLCHFARNPENTDEVTRDHECWILDVEDGKIVRINTYRDMACHRGWGQMMAAMRVVDDFAASDLGRMVIRTRTLVETQVPPENMVLG